MLKQIAKTRVVDRLGNPYDFQDTDDYKGGTITAEQIERDEGISTPLENGNHLYIPFEMRIQGVVTIYGQNEEVYDPTCPKNDPPTDELHFEGLNDIVVNQGIEIDLRKGVRAVLGHEQVPFDVSPEMIEKCAVGVHEVVYTATDGTQTITATRKCTIKAISDPVITAPQINVNAGEEFDPLEGASAKDGNGNSITVSEKE